MQFVGLVPADCIIQKGTLGASKKIFENTLPLREKDLLYFGSDENIGIHRGTFERSRCSHLATEPGDSPRIPQNSYLPRYQRF